MINKFKLINFEDVKDTTTEKYFSGEKFAVDMFDAKYSHIKEDGEKETPAEVFLRIAYELSRFEKSKDEQKHYCEMWFSLLWAGWFRPGGSIMHGVGSSSKVSLNNCTTIPLNGDSLEEINNCDYNVMKCAAFRQGIGVDVSELRPRGAEVNNAANKSTGIVPWVCKIVDNGKYVGQSGRMPALLMSLKVDHPDVEEFITAKMKQGVIENANISVQITNNFMDAVENDDDWELHFDFSGDSKYETLIKTVKAKKIFNLIAKTAHASAEPGVQYIDLMKKGSMVQCVANVTGDKKYEIISTNACSEKPLPAFGVCNLLSINMEMFSTNAAGYKKELEFIVPYLVRLSDNVVTYELSNKLSPVPEQRTMVESLREVGMGATNIHGWFLKQDLAYDSGKATKSAEDFFKHYAYNVFKTSVALGKEKGNSPAFDMVKDKKEFMNSIYFNNIITEFFEGDASKIKTMRNMAHMSIAPTGSLSNSFPTPCISSGIEPVIGLYYWRRTRAVENGVYVHYFVIPNLLKKYILSKIDKESEDYLTLMKFSGSERDEDGTIGKELVEIINKYIPAGFFKFAHEIDYKKKINLMASVYKWIDAAISCTYNLPSTSTPEDVEAIYIDAYKKGVRAVSVYVDGSREGVLIFNDPVTNRSKFERKKDICNKRPESIQINCAPKRHDVLECNIHQISIKGEMWTVLVGMLYDIPFEIFCGQAEDLYIPKNCKKGKILKKGHGKYSLEIMIRRSPVEYKDLAQVLMTDEERSLTRLLSLNLRHGVPLQFISEQLKKSNGGITTFSTAISRVLTHYIKNTDYVYKAGEKKCPGCGNSTMVFKGGCFECVECGYSKCG